jgi:hypothetical protein
MARKYFSRLHFRCGMRSKEKLLFLKLACLLYLKKAQPNINAQLFLTKRFFCCDVICLKKNICTPLLLAVLLNQLAARRVIESLFELAFNDIVFSLKVYLFLKLNDFVIPRSLNDK